MIEIREEIFFAPGRQRQLVYWDDITFDELENIFGVREQLFAQMMGWA